jgi:hypothetical protein
MQCQGAMFKTAWNPTQFCVFTVLGHPCTSHVSAETLSAWDGSHAGDSGGAPGGRERALARERERE